MMEIKEMQNRLGNSNLEINTMGKELGPKKARRRAPLKKEGKGKDPKKDSMSQFDKEGSSHPGILDTTANKRIQNTFDQVFWDSSKATVELEIERSASTAKESEEEKQGNNSLDDQQDTEISDDSAEGDSLESEDDKATVVFNVDDLKEEMKTENRSRADFSIEFKNIANDGQTKSIGSGKHLSSLIEEEEEEEEDGVEGEGENGVEVEGKETGRSINRVEAKEQEEVMNDLAFPPHSLLPWMHSSQFQAPLWPYYYPKIPDQKYSEFFY